MFNKKSVVTTSTYILILLILILVLIGTYFFYINNKNDVIKLEYEKELFVSLSKFRFEIINIIQRENSSIIYNDKYSLNGVEILLEEDKISGLLIEKNGYATINLPTLGLIFCSNYSFYPVESSTFVFNGSCISMS